VVVRPVAPLQAIEALRIFAAQREISETCSCTLTDGVYVEVVPAFISVSHFKSWKPRLEV